MAWTQFYRLRSSKGPVSDEQLREISGHYKRNSLEYRPTFANQITSGVASAEARNSIHKDRRYSLFMMLRRYRGLSSGYGVTNRAVIYEAFKLSLTFREAPPEEYLSALDGNLSKSIPTVNSSMLLVVSATPVKSIYKSELKIDFTLAKL